MIFVQRLGISGTNLIVKGESYNFDVSGIYQRRVPLNFTNIEPVKVISYIAQGGVAEKADITDEGLVVNRSQLTVKEMMDTLIRERSASNCLGVLIRNISVEGVATTNYLLLYRRK